ncbi:MAG TPA: hypothetical protein VFV38_13220 [Ktedonobacteraceae bacterium]|nr:hypothetical protein [Ktedonobacteraceae bacterium]
MAAQRWKAEWSENGLKREFIFDSLNNRMIARIDFRLKYACATNGAVKVPENFSLEEVLYGDPDAERGADFLGDAAFPHAHEH